MINKLEKSEILKRRSDFATLIRQGNRLSSKHITLYFTESNTLKYGFAVSRKVGNAVKRNKARRRIREILRQQKEMLPNKKKVVVFIRPGCERIEFCKLEREYVNLLKKVKEKV